VNKPKHRMEQALISYGFVKVEPDYWALFLFTPGRPMSRLDAELGAAALATYAERRWTLRRGRSIIHVDTAEEVAVALDLLGVKKL